jgi:predicted RNase H-like nuclease (RuvC/YqgF family)
MADDTKSWFDMAAAILAGGGVLAFFQWLLGGRKKEGSESDKLKAETETLKMKSGIEWADYYKRELSGALVEIEELQKKNKAVQQENQKLQESLESLKRTLTTLTLQLNNK